MVQLPAGRALASIQRVFFSHLCLYTRRWYCWWFRNPANQLRLVVYPRWIAGFLNHQQYHWPTRMQSNNDPKSIHGIHELSRSVKKWSCWKGRERTPLGLGGTHLPFVGLNRSVFGYVLVLGTKNRKNMMVVLYPQAAFNRGFITIIYFLGCMCHVCEQASCWSRFYEISMCEMLWNEIGFEVL